MVWKLSKDSVKSNGTAFWILGANACTGICNVANNTTMHASLFAEKYYRVLGNFRSADRSPLELAFSSIKMTEIVEHACNLNK
jgi:hypothetical protein